MLLRSICNQIFTKDALSVWRVYFPTKYWIYKPPWTIVYSNATNSMYVYRKSDKKNKV